MINMIFFVTAFTKYNMLVNEESEMSTQFDNRWSDNTCKTWGGWIE